MAKNLKNNNEKDIFSKKLFDDNLDFSESGLEADVNIDELKPKEQHIKVKILFLLFNIIVVVAILIIEKQRNGAIANLSDAISETRNGFVYILIAMSMFFVIVISEAACFMFMLKLSGNGAKPWTSIKTVTIGKYYDHITPFSMGGQPFQMYYLYKNGVDSATAFTAPVIRHAVKLFAVNLVIIALYIINPTDAALGIKIAAYVGVGFNLTFPLFAVIVAVKKEVGAGLAKFGVKIGYKLKLIKDYDKTLEKIQRQVDEFIRTLRFLTSHIGLSFIIGVLSIIEVFALVSVPYFVIRGFGYNVNFLDTIVKATYAMNAASYVPTPGTAGGAEAYFYGLFGDTLGAGNIFWPVMLWRFITYYSYLIIGNVINITMVIGSTIKTRNYNNKLLALKKEIAERRARTAEERAEKGITNTAKRKTQRNKNIDIQAKDFSTDSNQNIDE